MSKVELGRQQIEQLIPHREPFIFLDRVTEIEERRSAVGWMDDPRAVMEKLGIEKPMIFPRPIFIELLSELLIIAGGVPQDRIALLAGLDDWEFTMYEPIGPVRLAVQLDRVIQGLGRGYGEASSAGNLVARGNILFGIINKPS